MTKRQGPKGTAARAQFNAAIGQRVRARRQAVGLNQERLGQLIGCSFQHVARLESGERSIDVATLVSIAKALRCAPSDFLQDFADSPLSRDAVKTARTIDEMHSPALRELVKTFITKLSELAAQ